MGILFNRYIPKPESVPTWEQIRNGVTATTNFDFSNLDYTEYLIIVYAKNTTNFYQFFVIPEMNTSQRAGYTNFDVYMDTVNGNSNQRSFRIYSDSNTVTNNWRYTVYGRKKAAWSLVSDNSALPNYTELITGNGYYTPFNYQEYHWYRITGGSHPSYSTVSDYKENIYNNQYTFGHGNGVVYTRLSSSEASWNHIQTTGSSPRISVSIENISYSEMFIIGKKLRFSNYDSFQAVYLTSSMPKGTFYAGGCTRYQSSTANEYTDGDITVSDTTVSAYYRKKLGGTTSYTTQSIDIYYR